MDAAGSWVGGGVKDGAAAAIGTMAGIDTAAYGAEDHPGATDEAVAGTVAAAGTK
jgi:hypothetical protein